MTRQDLATAAVASAAQGLRHLQSEIEACREELKRGASEVCVSGVTGSSLVQWSDFAEHTRKRARSLEGKAQQAQQELSARLQELAVARQKVQLLENLKHTAQREWQAALQRELEAFAGESHLIRLQSRKLAGA